jgi:aldose 1-epimerase
MLPSGEQYELRFEDQWACVVEVGGGLRAYTVEGEHVLDGFEADEMCRSGRGQVLAPWPNRISRGEYTFDGETYQLALTEPAAGNAIHGLVRWSLWKLLEHEPDRVVLEHRLYPQSGYPFALHLEVDYRLDADGLSVTASATNTGDRACPFGLGFHPYLKGVPTVDELVLHVPASSPADFARPRQIADTALDTTFTGLERDADRLARVQVGGSLVWFDESFPYVQLFTGDPLPDVARRSLAVEPMTCPPNAFRTGKGLIRLEPGERFRGRWGIHAHASS